MYMDQSQIDPKKDAKIQELESLLTEYKQENQNLLTSIHELEAKPAGSSAIKRPREGDENSAEAEERIGQLTRKLRKLQGDLESLATKNAQLSAELTAREAQLDSKATTSSRILQLRDNPTAIHERTKLETLNLLRAENDALRAQMDSSPNPPSTVPRASVELLRKEQSSLQQQLADRDKRITRLRQVFAAKCLEFKQAINSIMGVEFEFMPNGRVRVSSPFWSAKTEDGITFDGEEGTMKITGEEFRKSIEPLVKLWVEQRGIPAGLVATLVKEGYEKKGSIAPPPEPMET